MESKTKVDLGDTEWRGMERFARGRERNRR